MTVSTINAYSGPLFGNGSVKSFPFTFKAMGVAEISVIYQGEDGSETPVAPSDYSVTISSASGGSVNFVNAPPAGTRILILSNPALDQEIGFDDESPWLAGPHNEGLDRGAVRDQALKRDVERGWREPLGEAGVIVPPALARKGAVLAFDHITGKPIVGPVIATVESVATVSGYLATIAAHVDDIETVGNSIASVNAVAPIVGDVATVANNIGLIDAVVDDIVSVRLVGSSISNVNAVAGNLTEILNAPSHADAALAAKNAAETARNGAVSARDAAAGSASTAESARDVAVSARNSAESYRNAAQTARDGAVSSRDSAAASADSAADSATDADAARIAAEAARDEAQSIAGGDFQPTIPTGDDGKYYGWDKTWRNILAEHLDAGPASGAFVLGRSGATGAIGRLALSSSASANAIAIRDANGRMKAAAPNAGDDVANQDYVLDAVELGQKLSPHMPILGNPKPAALNRAAARAMVDDHSEMVGYASHAVTTGGAGKPEYWVTNSSDDVNFVGSLRWAVAQALAGGGGKIIFDTRGYFDIVLRSLLLVGASAATVCNITIDAPARNVRIRNLPTVEGIRLSGQNIIFRRIEICNLAETWADETERDAFSLNPIYCDKIWVNQCTIGFSADGVGDISSSALEGATPLCRVTYNHNIYRNQDKTILIGKSATTTPVQSATAYRVLLTLHENWFHGCGQRTPSVYPYAFAHMVNNVLDITPFQRQDGVSGGTSGARGSLGGAVWSNGDLFRSLHGLAIEAVGGDATGVYEHTGSVGENGITFSRANISYLPAIPYSLPASAVPAAGAARSAWVTALLLKCGAGQYPYPPEEYVFRAGASPRVPDGNAIIPVEGGYLERVKPTKELQLQSNPFATILQDAELRGTTTLAGGATIVDTAESTFLYFASDTYIRADKTGTKQIRFFAGGVEAGSARQTQFVFAVNPFCSVAPTSDNHLVNRGYVTTQRDTRLAKAGDTFTGGFSKSNATPALTGASITPDASTSNLYKYSNTGNFTINAPSSNNGATIVMEIINATGAGTMATAGFNNPEISEMTTAVGDKFLVTIVVVGSGSKYITAKKMA